MMSLIWQDVQVTVLKFEIRRNLKSSGLMGLMFYISDEAKFSAMNLGVRRRRVCEWIDGVYKESLTYSATGYRRNYGQYETIK